MKDWFNGLSKQHKVFVAFAVLALIVAVAGNL